MTSVDKNKKLEDRLKFIKLYKAAVDAKLSKEQLAAYLNVKPDSIIRRRLVIQESIGIILPYLPSDESDISTEKLQKFRIELGKLTRAENKIINNPVEDEFDECDRIIITSAQNYTPIFNEFLASIFTYMKTNPKTLFKVIPYRYKNPTSIFQDKDREYWDPKIMPYILDYQVKIFDNLQLVGQLKRQPTADYPVNGFEALTGTDSAIIGHPKIQWKTIPTPSKSFPKILTSTGAITVPNYTDSAAGLKGKHHHSFAAVIIELDRKNKIFHIRHIHADKEDGGFYDIAKGVLRRYSPNDVTVGERVTALVTGDTHAIYHDPTVEKATYTDRNSILNLLKPENHFIHDLNDCYTVSHHHMHSRTIRVGKHRFGRNNLERELQIAADLLDNITREDMKTYIVKSNHDEHFDKWLETANPDLDPENSQFFHWMRYNKEKFLTPTNTGFKQIDPFEFWCTHPDQERGLKNVHLITFLKRDQDVVINNIDFSFHGDRGANGGKGSLQSFAKSGTKVVIGHSHYPGIHEGAYQVGLSAYIDLEYKSGLDSWLNTHCIVYPDGKRTLINIINSKWFL